MRTALAAALLLLLLSACSGNALVRVKPYEREYFAQEKMGFVTMQTRTAFEEHVFSIREGASGGSSSLQGGCGCK